MQQSRLDAGTATTWCFDRAAILAVQRGRVWITLDGEPPAKAPRGGDWFLDAGMVMRLEAGRRAVLEPAGRAGEAAWMSVVAEPVTLVGWWRSFRRRWQASGVAST